MRDLEGRVCLVTGATRGIGRATAAALAARGAAVIVHGRNRRLVDEARRGIGHDAKRADVAGVVADLSSLADVRRLAGETLAEHDRLDVLVNNAGAATRQRRTSADGFEWQFAVNHLAPFLLTNLLLARIKATGATGATARTEATGAAAATGSARIVTVASNAHRRARLDFDDLSWERRKYDGLQAYGASKLANILFTRELAARLAGTGVTANCLHPGVVATNIFSGMGVIGTLFGIVMRPFLLSPAKGAATAVYLASSPDVAQVNGKYFADCAETEPSPAATDEAAARRLWQISAHMTGLAR